MLIVIQGKMHCGESPRHEWNYANKSERGNDGSQWETKLVVVMLFRTVNPKPNDVCSEQMTYSSTQNRVVCNAKRTETRKEGAATLLHNNHLEERKAERK